MQIHGFAIEVTTKVQETRNKGTYLKVEVTFNNHLKSQLPNGDWIQKTTTAGRLVNMETAIHEMPPILADLLGSAGFRFDLNKTRADVICEMYCALVPDYMCRYGVCNHCGAIGGGVTKGMTTNFCPACAETDRKYWEGIHQMEADRHEQALCKKCRRCETIGGLCFQCEDDEQSLLDQVESGLSVSAVQIPEEARSPEMDAILASYAEATGLNITARPNGWIGITPQE